MLVDFSGTELTGKVAEETLEKAGITVNKNAVPFDTRSPFVTSGIRIGTPATTTRGLRKRRWNRSLPGSTQALENIDNDGGARRKSAGKYANSVKRFPLYAHRLVRMTMIRPSWEEYFMDIARLVARRSTCLRRQVGAVMVKDKNILATGYNGTPSGIRPCAETSAVCVNSSSIPSGERHELCRGLHAEQNAIIQAAKHGINIGGSSLFTAPILPVMICSKMMINAGVERIVFLEGYPDTLSLEMLREAGIAAIPLSQFLSRDRRMKCPFCDFPDTKVIDSRLGKEGNTIRRRRECIECGRRFTTYERVEESIPLVVKKDGRREAFDRQKIIAGMQRACEKRPVSIAHHRESRRSSRTVLAGEWRERDCVQPHR